MNGKRRVKRQQGDPAGLLGQQVVVEAIAAGHVQLPGVGPALSYRIEGFELDGRKPRPALITVAITEENIDLFLAKIQEGVADFKERRAQEGA